MVAIHFNNMTVCDGWDTHSNNFEACEQELLPMLDPSSRACAVKYLSRYGDAVNVNTGRHDQFFDSVSVF